MATSRPRSPGATGERVRKTALAILGMPDDLGDLHNRCEPTERRIHNRALFDRIIIDEDEDISAVPA